MGILQERQIYDPQTKTGLRLRPDSATPICLSTASLQETRH